MDAERGHALLVGLGQSGLELVVSGDQALGENRRRCKALEDSAEEMGASEAPSGRTPSPLYLDLLDAVDNKHVLQVLHGAIHPVVEGGGPLGKLQIQLIDGLPQLLHTLTKQRRWRDMATSLVLWGFGALPVSRSYLQGVSPLLGESAQVVPLVTDALAARVDRGSIVVVELTADSETSLTSEYFIDLIFILLFMFEVSADRCALE